MWLFLSETAWDDMHSTIFRKARVFQGKIPAFRLKVKNLVPWKNSLHVFTKNFSSREVSPFIGVRKDIFSGFEVSFGI
jgi:hypothetical protein